MVNFWDKYGVWITVYVLLFIQANSSLSRYRLEDICFFGIFLPFNLVLTLATFFRFLTRKWKWFGLWGPLISRWIARWVGYTLVGALFGGLVFSVFGLILAPIIALLITVFHITDDVQATQPATRS